MRGLLIGGGLLMASLGHAAPLTLPLWPAGPPGAPIVENREEINARGGAVQVSQPAMTVHLPAPAEATGLAFIVCPGGSYREVGLFTTGMGTVDYFVPKGVAVIVLKYRTAPPSTQVVQDALMDAKRAVRLVRHHASAWGIDPAKIGMVGSSAGAHLILNTSSHSDDGQREATDPVERESCRPNFIGLLCPWPNAQPATDFPTGPFAPPAFVASARDDRIAPTPFAEGIAAAYRAAGRPCRLWILESGGHTAFRLGGRSEGGRWGEEFWQWLQATLPFSTTRLGLAPSTSITRPH